MQETVIKTAPRAPKGLSKSAQLWWRKLVPRLIELDVIDMKADYGRLVLLAQAWGMSWDAYQTIQDEGMFRKDEKGVTRKHPAHQVWRDSAAAYNSLGKELGLTPLSRNRLGVVADDENDELAAFLLRRPR
jgi:P27 family predicted phage terminase small subunit